MDGLTNGRAGERVNLMGVHGKRESQRGRGADREKEGDEGREIAIKRERE